MGIVMAPSNELSVRLPLLGLALSVLLLTTAHPVSAANDLPDSVRVGSYEIDATFHPEESSMAGEVSVEFTSPVSGGESLVFFLHNELQVDSVLVGGQPQPFASEEVDYFLNYSAKAFRTELTAPPGPDTEGLTVFYKGRFSPSSVRSPSDYMRIDEDGVFLRSYAYSLWFPVFLESGQSSYEVSFPRAVFRTPADFQTVFVGSRVTEHEEGQERVSEWRVDRMDLVMVQCTAQRFEVTSKGTIQAYHHPTEGSRASAKSMVTFTDELVREFRRVYGPGSSDGQVLLMEMPQYGMIASGNVAGFPTEEWQTFDEREGAKVGLAHELVHQFVFVPVEFTDPLWPLAIEGFPSYFHLPTLGRLTSEETYQERLARVERTYLSKREMAGKEGSELPPEKPLLGIPPEEMSRYKDRFVLSDRALLFLNFLRFEMGQEGFDEFTRDLFHRDRLDLPTFRRVLTERLPGMEDDIRTWLETTEYPPHLRLDALSAGVGTPGFLE